MNYPTTTSKIRNNVVENTITWMETIENEERRKLANALKRTQSVIDNPTNPKLILAKKELGDQPLEPVILKGERHGKTRFSLEYIPKDKLNTLSDFLYPEEAILVSEKVKVERSNYAHRLKLAFMFLAGKHGIKSSTLFHYSTDGDHFTKAFRSKNEVPDGEDTIPHEKAIEIIQQDAQINPTAYEAPAFGVSQTKVFRVSGPQTKEIFNHELNYSYKPHGDGKTSWIVISKGLEENKAYYCCKKIYTEESHVRANKNYKLVWPANQAKSLLYMLELCKELILNQSSKTLGVGDQYYAIIYEKKTARGPEGLLYKALIAQGKDKTEASKKACEVICQVWGEESKEVNPGKNTPKAITCLSLTDCSLLKHLIESENNIR